MLIYHSGRPRYLPKQNKTTHILEEVVTPLGEAEVGGEEETKDTYPLEAAEFSVVSSHRYQQIHQLCRYKVVRRSFGLANP